MQLGDIQRRRARRGLPSRPTPIPQMSDLQTYAVNLAGLGIDAQAADVTVQHGRIAEMLVFGPMMLYAGLGRATPRWVRVGMIIIGAGTIIYNLVNYLEAERLKRIEGTTDQLGQMSWGPMHRADPHLHRATLLTQTVARR